MHEIREKYRDYGSSKSDRYTTNRHSNHLGKFDEITESKYKSEIFDLESKLVSRDGKIAELEREVRNYKDIEGQQGKTMKTMHERIENLEQDAAELSALKSKNDLTITTLHSDNRQLQDRILDLEERLRRAMDAQDNTVMDVKESQGQYEELKNFLCKTLFSDTVDIRSHDTLMKKVKNHVDEYLDLKAEAKKLEDNLEGAEAEVRRNRDTVRKLLEDIDRTKKFTATTEILKEERDSAIRQEDSYKSEISRMEDRLLDAQKHWEEAQWELRQHQARMGEIDAVAKKYEMTSTVTQQEYKAFKDTLATLLSENYIPIPSTEDSIKDKIRQLMQKREDVTKVSNHLEDKLTEVSKQLEDQADLHKRAVQRAKKAESALDEYRLKLDGIEGELTATDILKEGLNADKEKYLKFLSQMADVMRMDEIVRGLGMELNGDALLARAEQLVRVEQDSFSGSKSVRYSNNAPTRHPSSDRNAKEMRRELDSKSMQLEIMKKKLHHAEQELTHRAEHDFEDVLMKSQRNEKTVDKLQRQYHEAKLTIQAMKKESVENQALKLTVDELKKQIFELERKCDELENIRGKQAKKLANLKHDKDLIAMDVNHGHKVTESTIQSLSNQLQRLKVQLEDAKKREKQLSDLRAVIARMLGLNITNLAIPDYEIISRLEKLIESQHDRILNFNPSKVERAKYSASPDPVQRGYLMEAQRRMKSRSGRDHSSASAAASGSRWK